MSNIIAASKNSKSIIVLLLILFLLPLIGSSSYILYTVGVVAIYSVISLGLNILVGYSGQISIGQAGFVAIGAYMSSILLNLSITPWIAIIAGGVLAGFIGFLIGMPATRLSGHYLAIITLVFGLAVGKLAMNLASITGGYMGISVSVSHPFFFALPESVERYYFIIIISVLLIWSATKFLKTRTGRALNAIRTGEIAAESMGIKPSKYKVIAFVISSTYAGIAGGLVAINAGFLHPTDFALFTSLFYLAMVVVGGQGSVLGSVLGALLLGFVPELLANFQSLAAAIMGLILIICMKVAPKGLASLFISGYRRFFNKKRGEMIGGNSKEETSKG